MSEIKNNKDLAKYIDELNKDVNLTISNLREKALLCSSIWAKWLSYLFHEKENLDRISAVKQKIMQKKLDNKNVDTVLRMKSVDKLSETDENLKKLNLLTKNTQTNIDFIERALNILQNFNFNIKNTTDILKLQEK